MSQAIGTHRVIHLQRKLDLTVKFLEFLFDRGLWSRETDTGRDIRAAAEPTALPRAQDLLWGLESLPGRGLCPPARPKLSTVPGVSLEKMGCGVPRQGGDAREVILGSQQCWEKPWHNLTDSSLSQGMGEPTLEPSPLSPPLCDGKQWLSHPFSSPSSFRGSGRISSGLVPLSEVCVKGRKKGRWLW